MRVRGSRGHTPWCTTGLNETRARISYTASNSSARPGKALEVAPIDDEKDVNRRRAELGLMRVELYARLVRLNLPDLCGPVSSQK